MIAEIKDIDKLNEALYGIQFQALRILEGLDSNEQTERLKTQIRYCKDATELIELTNKVLLLVLDG